MKGPKGRFSTIELLATLVLLFVTAPFLDELKHGEVMISCLTSLALIAAVLAVGAQRWRLVVAATLALNIIVARGVSLIYPDVISPVWTYLAALIFGSFVVVNLLRFVLKAPRVDAHVLCAAISAYLLIGLVWSAAYMLAAHNQPDAFSFNTTQGAKHKMTGFDAFYFSSITLTTVGYGDITPASRVARMLAVNEAITGVLFIAVLIARLVSLYAPRHSEKVSLSSEEPP